MSDTTYNGWTNYETWVVKLWMDNEQGSQEYWEEVARECLESNDCDKDAAASDLSSRLESEHDDALESMEFPTAGVFTDLLGHALGNVDWREIADNMLGDIPVYCAGWNMPGYMPDNPPAAFLDADDALEYIKDSAKESLDDVVTGETVDAAMAALADADAQEAEIDAWKAYKNGEFGQTFGAYHYFVSLA